MAPTMGVPSTLALRRACEPHALQGPLSEPPLHMPLPSLHLDVLLGGGALCSGGESVRVRHLRLDLEQRLGSVRSGAKGGFSPVSVSSHLGRLQIIHFRLFPHRVLGETGRAGALDELSGAQGHLPRCQRWPHTARIAGAPTLCSRPTCGLRASLQS